MPAGESRPEANRAANVSADNLDPASMPPATPRERQLERRADTALRCAQLRLQARDLEAVATFDEYAAWTRVQFLDLADLLEAVDREGWR